MADVDRSVPGDPGHVVIAEGPVPRLKELQRELEHGGVHSQMMQPPGGCGSG